MAEANIIVKAIDQFSQKINSMANANKGFSKSMEESQRAAQQLSQRQDALLRKQAELKTSLDSATKALKDAKKAFLETGDAAQKENLRAAHENFDRLKDSISGTTKELKDCRKEMDALEAKNRRNPGGGGAGGGSGGNLAATLGKSGLASAVGDWASNLAGVFVQSAGGDEASTLFSGALGMAGTGAAIGSFFGPLGTAIGAAVGAIGGVISGAAENFVKKDEYFKDAVQDAYDSFTQGREALVSSGSETAARREVDELAFNKLLGAGIGTQYLSDLRNIAAHTPLEYDQLTEISRQLAIGFGGESDRMLELIEVVGDAGSAVGLDASGMQTIATALSRMQSSDKVTLEYLNLIQERGIDAIGIIGAAKGMTTAQVYNAISKGSLDGSDVVDILQKGLGEKYGGAMQEQSQTYTGLQSTLADQETERKNLAGELYNSGRIASMEQEIAFNDSAIGQDVAWVDSLSGMAQATAENIQKRYEQEALTYLHTGKGLGEDWNEKAEGDIAELREQYLLAYNKFLTSSGEDRALAAAEMKNIQDTARGLGESAYEMSEYYQALGELDKDFIEGLQKAEANGYYQLGYEIGQQLSKGIRAATGLPDTSGVSTNVDDYPTGAAYGLQRVPYNDYPMRLHEGERVLTAQQARQMDAAGHTGGVVVSGNHFVVREEADIGRIASELARQIAVAKLSYAG